MIDTWCIAHCSIVASVSFKWNKNSFDVKIFWIKVKYQIYLSVEFNFGKTWPQLLNVQTSQWNFQTEIKIKFKNLPEFSSSSATLWLDSSSAIYVTELNVEISTLFASVRSLTSETKSRVVLSTVSLIVIIQLPLSLLQKG